MGSQPGASERPQLPSYGTTLLGALPPTWRLALLLLVMVMNGAALRVDFVLPTPAILFQFWTFLITAMDYDDNGLKILPK